MSPGYFRSHRWPHKLRRGSWDSGIQCTAVDGHLAGGASHLASVVADERGVWEGYILSRSPWMNALSLSSWSQGLTAQDFSYFLIWDRSYTSMRCFWPHFRNREDLSCGHKVGVMPSGKNTCCLIHQSLPFIHKQLILGDEECDKEKMQTLF